MHKHIRILALLYLAFGTLGLLIGGFVFVLLAAGSELTGQEDAGAFALWLGIVLAALSTVLAVPEIIGGMGLLRTRSWARIFVLVLGFLNLANVPLGTPLGVYTIWVLMNDRTDTIFARRTGPTGPGDAHG